MEVVPSLHTTLHVLGTSNFQLKSLDIAFHCAIVPLKAILVRPLQPKKAELPMLVTLSGIVILVSLAQCMNAALPMLVTPSGIVMLVKLLQL